MSRVKTQDDFINKAKVIHGDKYDYSKVVYVRTNQKVTIMCPIHGEFEMTPLHHLRGQGCHKCTLENQKIGLDEFVRRAKSIHGDRYDYSHAVYVTADAKLEIICPIHGSFMMTPHCHITLKQNCPKCANISGGQKRSGNNNPMKKESAKRKAQATCLERYGTKTYAESEEGRRVLREIITSDDVQSRTIQTCMDRYGTKTWTQSIQGRERLHEIMSSAGMQERVRQGYIAAYGVDHYMKTPEGRDKARYNISQPDRRIAIRDAFVDKYGVPNALASPIVQEKIQATVLDRYGVKHIQPYLLKYHPTFGKSRAEENLYILLCDVFGKANVARQYRDFLRYPFHCDFYIKPFDLFIELNASWTHGGHWFDEHNPLDVEKLFMWHQKSVEQHSDYYRSAINTWTNRDPLKRYYAENYNLNYLVFWDTNLKDAKIWLNQFQNIKSSRRL